MQCVICKHGETTRGASTVLLDRDGVTIVLRNVPADICTTCGEAYYSEDVTRRILETAEQAACAGAHVDIREYAA